MLGRVKAVLLHKEAVNTWVLMSESIISKQKLDQEYSDQSGTIVKILTSS